MLNWRRLKNVTLAAAAASSALVSVSAHSAGMDKDFKFPIVLCRFKQAVLRDTGGTLKIVADQDWGPEYAFPVGNVQAVSSNLTGDFSGTYEIPNSPYRVRIDGDINQSLNVATNHQLHLRTVLEKKMDKADASGKLWQEVGNSANAVIANNQSDGTVWENVYPYTFNSAEMQRYMIGGKLKQELVTAGIRDGLLDKGSVFKVGPACGFLDGKTAKSVASAEDRQRYRAIFDQISDAPAAPVIAAQPEPQKPQMPQVKVELKLPEPAVAQASGDERGLQQVQEEKERFAQSHAVDPAQAAAPTQQEMSPELQTQLAQQNQLADQAAAAYNFQQQQAQSGLAQTGMPMPAAGPADGRDLASAQTTQQMPQANSVGQIAQNLQALQSPEQVQQHMQMLEQQRAALAQQQSMIDQQQAFLAQKQQDLASNTNVVAPTDSQVAPAADVQQIQTSQAAPQTVPSATQGQSF